MSSADGVQTSTKSHHNSHRRRNRSSRLIGKSAAIITTMAIHTKKRDRVAVALAAKRDRVAAVESKGQGSASAALSAVVPDDRRQEEEYERAVAFLREFHSRRTANHLHSTSLDAILETDRFEDVLASDFALALSVGGGSSSRSRDPEPAANDPAVDEAGRDSPFLKVVADVPPPGGRGADGRSSEPGLRRTKRSSSGSGPSKMKRASTSKCLLDLDDKSPTSSSPSGLFASCNLRTPSGSYPPGQLEPDFYFGYDCEQEGCLRVTKRHRGHRGQPRLATGVFGR